MPLRDRFAHNLKVLIESYGIPIDWSTYTEESFEHPLIKLLINYFRISDKIAGITPEDSDELEYARWVERRLLSGRGEETIRNYTMYRPRHIVRLLNIAKLRCGNHTKIGDATFTQIKRQYSSDCWNEVEEGLTLSYTDDELRIIKEWLTGMPWRTTYTDMLNKAKRQWKETQSGENLLSRFDDVMRDLYQAGVVGNYSKPHQNLRPTHRWYFRGDATLLKDQEIQIHRIFEPVLSTVKPSFK